MITWHPYPNQRDGHYALVGEFALVADHEGRWAVWKHGALSRNAQAFIDGSIDRHQDVTRARASADNFPRLTWTMEEAKRAAEAALNELTPTT